MQKVLVLDDAEEIFFLVKTILGGAYDVSWAPSLEVGRRELASSVFDLILLDVTLPDGNGFHFFTELKNKAGWVCPPVIFFTGKGEVSEKVLGFSLGADDYITKSLDLLEMKARIEAKLRRIQEQDKQTDVERRGPLEIRHSSQEVFFDGGQGLEPLALTRIEFKILCLLLARMGEITGREEILDRVWGKGFHVYPRSVDTHVSNLRRKLPESAIKIENVHGQGYRLILNA